MGPTALLRSDILRTGPWLRLHLYFTTRCAFVCLIDITVLWSVQYPNHIMLLTWLLQLSFAWFEIYTHVSMYFAHSAVLSCKWIISDVQLGRDITQHWHTYQHMGITYLFSNFNGATVVIWEWINNYTLHFNMHVITFPCWFIQC